MHCIKLVPMQNDNQAVCLLVHNSCAANMLLRKRQMICFRVNGMGCLNYYKLRHPAQILPQLATLMYFAAGR